MDDGSVSRNKIDFFLLYAGKLDFEKYSGNEEFRQLTMSQELYANIEIVPEDRVDILLTYYINNYHLLLHHGEKGLFSDGDTYLRWIVETLLSKQTSEKKLSFMKTNLENHHPETFLLFVNLLLDEMRRHKKWGLRTSYERDKLFSQEQLSELENAVLEKVHAFINLNDLFSLTYSDFHLVVFVWEKIASIDPKRLDVIRSKINNPSNAACFLQQKLSIFFRKALTGATKKHGK
ncbi:MAG: hypothetical protein ACK5LL_06515 [Suipraeoptans sp.]